MSNETTRKKQRFEIRDAANQIAVPVAQYMSRFDRVQSCSTYDAIAVYDSIDYVMSIDTQVKEFRNPTGRFFDALSDIDIEISFSYDAMANASGDVDSVFYHSDIPYNEGGDMGVISVFVTLPSDYRIRQRFLQGMAVEIRAALAHEMQHACLLYTSPSPRD